MHPLATAAALFHTFGFVWCHKSRLLPTPCLSVWCHDSRILSARCLSNERMARSFSVVDDIKGGEPYDTVEYSRAFFSLFEGAIYLHQVRNDADVVARMSYASGFFLSQTSGVAFHRTLIEMPMPQAALFYFLCPPVPNPPRAQLHFKHLRFHAMLRVPRSKTRLPTVVVLFR